MDETLAVLAAPIYAALMQGKGGVGDRQKLAVVAVTEAQRLWDAVINRKRG